MNRLLVRFVIVLLAGGAALWLATRGEKAHRNQESPTVHSGPLGELGGRTERGPSGVHVNPIRDICVTLLEEVRSPSGSEVVFQPIGEVRGSKAEFVTPVRQRIKDAVAVYELADEKLTVDERQAVFGAVTDYVPPTADDARRREATASRDRPRLTHLRIQAAEAVLLNLVGEGAYRVVEFHGAPPDGVKVTLFAAGGDPALEMRTATLRCAARITRGEPLKAFITSEKRVSVFTPDGRNTLTGIGLHGVLIDAGSRSGRGSIELRRDIRFKAIGGISRSEGKTPPRTRDRITVITCAGPAVLHARSTEVPGAAKQGAAPKRRVVLDDLVLHNGVEATERFTSLDRSGQPKSHIELDLRSDHLQVRLADGRGVDWADAVGKVRVKSRRSMPAGTDSVGQPKPPSETTIAMRGERARLENPSHGPRRVRIFAWSFPPAIRLPLVPRHVSPVVEGTFRDAETEDARFHVRADGDIELESLDPDLSRRQFRVAMNKNVVVEIQGLRRGTDREAGAPGDKKKSPSWLPGSSVIHVRDRFVLDYLGVPGRWLEFSAKGRVRIDTLLGKFSAEEVRGDLPNRDRWTVEATGYPRLEHPIVSRSAPHLAKALGALSLTPAVSGASPAESSGMLVVEGRRAILDFRRDRTDTETRVAGTVRFLDAVQVTQSETSAEAARLVCNELSFGFARGNRAADKGDTRSLRAEGDVVFEAGESVRFEGDLFTFDPSKGNKRARVVLHGMPASLALATRDGNQGTLDGRTLEIDAGAEMARVRGGVLARFRPTRGDFLLPGGAPGREVKLAEVEIEAEEATIRWTRDAAPGVDAETGKRRRRGFEITLAEASQAVRIRTFGPSRATRRGESAERGPLMQWAEADRLTYRQQASEQPGAAPLRRITLHGEVDYPVRIGYTAAQEKRVADFVIEVPVVVIEGASNQERFDAITGFGAGHLVFGSQDNAYGSSSRAGADRAHRITAHYARGFRIIRIEDNRYRLFFPGGARIESRDVEGRLESLVQCSKELGLLVNGEARDKKDDLRVVEHGYAEGDVFFRYGGDTKGGCERAFWERGTNILTLDGSPAWIQRAGDARPHTFERAFYNRATRRFRISKGSGSLRRRFESAARKKKKTDSKDGDEEPELDVKEDIFPELPTNTR